MLLKITPEPTPVGGMTPRLPVSVAPVTRILTTAGLTLVATAMVADDSSMATGWRAPALVDCGDVTTAAGRSRAPAALSARTVPPEARTADRRAAASNAPAAPPIATRRAGRRRPSRRASARARTSARGSPVARRPRSAPNRSASRAQACSGRRSASRSRGRARARRRVRRDRVDRADRRARVGRPVGSTGGTAWRWVRSDGSVASVCGIVMHGAGRCLGGCDR